MARQYHMPRRTVVMLALAGSSLSLASSFAAKSAAAQAAAPDTPKAKSFKALVNKAVALTGSKGKAALTEFRQKGSVDLEGTPGHLRIGVYLD